MLIGINCLRVDSSSVGGVNTYTMGLLDAFANVGNGHSFRLYTTPKEEHLFVRFRDCPYFEVKIVDDPLIGLKKRLCRAALLSHNQEVYRAASNLLFASARKVIDSEVDIVYTPTTVLQWFNSRKPSVITMHDIQQVHYPEFFSWSVRLSRRITYKLTARYATYFQAISEFTKNDFLFYFRELSPENVKVIPSGVNIRKFAATSDERKVREKYKLPERFLFFPANLWPHKNHIAVLKALKNIERQYGLQIPLVLTGGTFSSTPEEIFEFIDKGRMTYVLALGQVPDQDMAALYHCASFMITATVYEATSLPVLEAAAAGTPIIASRIPPLEELARTLELNLFDPRDSDSLSRLIISLWNDEKLVAAQVKINRQRITEFSWENTARKYLDLFERIIAHEGEEGAVDLHVSDAHDRVNVLRA